MEEIRVHPRIHERHPQIENEDVVVAWKHILRWSYRLHSEKDTIVAIGFDGKSRSIEMVGVVGDGFVLIYHAFTPPTKKILRELGMR